VLNFHFFAFEMLKEAQLTHHQAPVMPHSLALNMYFLKRLLCIGLLLNATFDVSAQQLAVPESFRVIGYYAGHTIPIDSFETEKLTHLIYCFGVLDGNRFHLRSAKDSSIIKRMVELKRRQPSLKVMLSLGGWGGCEPCSDVFNTASGREEFARSVKEVTDYFNTDGLDLDWEYPVVKGFPGHAYRPEDKENFTMLVKEIRQACGPEFELSFAAGGFTTYIDSAIEWKQVVQYVDFINVMSYDLVHGYSTTSGHHTPLYSTPQQVESTDHAVQMLLNAGVPSEKVVIGAAFYGRYFKIEEGNPVGLFQPCKFSHAFSFRNAADSLSAANGFSIFWDETAQAPYAINVNRRLLATFDNERSVALKTEYALKNRLGGIMFWQLYDDKFRGGLLDVIYKNK
jgi:chitinase